MFDLSDRTEAPASSLASPSETAVASPPPAPRLDLYGPIHQTLRAAMARVLVSLGALDVSDGVECGAVLRHARELLALVDSHLHHEEEHLHPALAKVEPALVADTEREHAWHRTAIASLGAEIDALERRPDAPAAQGLYRRFSLFVAENHEHMHVEETQLNAVLWAHFDDSVLQRMHDSIVASIPADEMAATLALMLPALTPPQRAGMLGGMQHQMPPDAMRGVLDIAESVLDPAGWRKLCVSLGLPVRAAA